MFETTAWISLSTIKADAMAITAFQVGMYAFMICGFVTSLPINWLHVTIGWKEAMG
jgi:hypothetical protein